MAKKWSTNKEKVIWLVDHEALWIHDYEASPEAVAIRMAKTMRRHRLYHPDTDPETVKCGPLIDQALKILKEEESLF